MKKIKKIRIALLLNTVMFLNVGFTFITLATADEIVVWKFVASLIAFLGFGSFVLLLLREFLKIRKKITN